MAKLEARTVSAGASATEGAATIVAQLAVTNRLLAILVAKSFDPKQAIPALSSAGLQPNEIAAALGVTPNAVRVALHRLRKAAGATNQSSGVVPGPEPNDSHDADA